MAFFKTNTSETKLLMEVGMTLDKEIKKYTRRYSQGKIDPAVFAEWKKKLVDEILKFQTNIQNLKPRGNNNDS